MQQGPTVRQKRAPMQQKGPTTGETLYVQQSMGSAVVPPAQCLVRQRRAPMQQKRPSVAGKFCARARGLCCASASGGVPRVLRAVGVVFGGGTQLVLCMRECKAVRDRTMCTASSASVCEREHCACVRERGRQGGRVCGRVSRSRSRSRARALFLVRARSLLNRIQRYSLHLYYTLFPC